MATLMLGSWPEPFGLVAIESMATGTPVIARHAGALPEIVRHGVDGLLVDDLLEAAYAVHRVRSIDRSWIRGAFGRFSAVRMAAEYEAVYRTLVRRARDTRGRRGTFVVQRTIGSTPRCRARRMPRWAALVKPTELER
jgi:glycogen synthase